MKIFEELVTNHLGKLLIMLFLGGLSIGLLIYGLEKDAEVAELEAKLNETQEQLLISNDQLKQIEMRNEAIYYMNELERQQDDVDE